jgi:Kef-type K+ transport system membrane component KefB
MALVSPSPTLSVVAQLGAIRHGRKVMLQTGVGMIPRGEVGLIVGMIGLTMHIISPSVYTLVVSVSLLTTLITPPLIRWAFKSETGILLPVAEKAHRLQA